VGEAFSVPQGGSALYTRAISTDFIDEVNYTPPTGGSPVKSYHARLTSLKVGPTPSSNADYDAGYDYDDVKGRLNLVTGPGLYTGGATISYTANSDLISQIGFKNSLNTGLAATINKTQRGLLEIKHGSSLLGRTYQLRLMLYHSLKCGEQMTVYSPRPIRPTLRAWLDQWGVMVDAP
jgi:hypothetical protein